MAKRKGKKKMSKPKKVKKTVTKKTITDASSSNVNPSTSQMKTRQMSKTEKMEIDKSSSSNQSTSQIPKMPERKGKKSETKNSCSSANPTKSENTEDDLMDVCADDFKDIRYMPAFLDKTMLIKTLLLKKHRGILLIAPRRFGKSINLSMIKHFFEILPDKEAMTANRKLFEDLNIGKEESIMKDHQGKWPVILLDFKCDCTVDSHVKAIAFIRTVVHKAYQRHGYLTSSDKLMSDSEKRDFIRWCDGSDFKNIPLDMEEIKNGLENLARYLQTHFGKEVLLLVDEYDSLCSKVVMQIEDTKVSRDIIEDCLGSISCLAKSNDNVGRVVLTGISYLATMSLSGLSGVIKPFKFQEENVFSKFYGVTQEEFEHLLEKFPRSHSVEEVRVYYNGYRGDIVNIFSFMNYLNDNELGNYWRRSGIVNNLSKVLHIPAVRTILCKLLSDLSNEIEINYFSKLEYQHILKLRTILCSNDLDLTIEAVHVFLNFILEQGYLKLTYLDKNNGKCNIQIPNQEIRSEFQEQFISCFSEVYEKIDMKAVRSCASLFDELNMSDENNDKVLRQICDSLNRIINPIEFQKQNEATLHHIIFLVLFFSSNFKIFSEIRNAIKDPKRLDLLMLNVLLELGIIIELKYDRDTVIGLKQIKDNGYSKCFRNIEYNPEKKPVKYRLYIALNMSKEQKITTSVLFNCLNLSKKVNYN